MLAVYPFSVQAFSAQYWAFTNVQFFLRMLVASLDTARFPLFSETSFSRGLPTCFWHDPGAVWPPGALEEEWPEEGSAPILDTCSKQRRSKQVSLCPVSSEEAANVADPNSTICSIVHHNNPNFPTSKTPCHRPAVPREVAPCWNIFLRCPGIACSFLYAMSPQPFRLTRTRSCILHGLYWRSSPSSQGGYLHPPPCFLIFFFFFPSSLTFVQPWETLTAFFFFSRAGIPPDFCGFNWFMWSSALLTLAYLALSLFQDFMRELFFFLSVFWFTASIVLESSCLHDGTVTSQFVVCHYSGMVKNSVHSYT